MRPITPQVVEQVLDDLVTALRATKSLSSSRLILEHASLLNTFDIARYLTLVDNGDFQSLCQTIVMIAMVNFTSAFRRVLLSRRMTAQMQLSNPTLPA
jgi:hypothetical protein